MKVIKIKELFLINPINLIVIFNNSIRFYKNNNYHNQNGPAIIHFKGLMEWHYNGALFGLDYNNSYKIKKWWKRKVKKLKYKEKMKVFI